MKYFAEFEKWFDNKTGLNLNKQDMVEAWSSCEAFMDSRTCGSCKHGTKWCEEIIRCDEPNCPMTNLDKNFGCKFWEGKQDEKEND